MMTPEQAEAVRMERQALTELTQAKILRAAYSERQLEEVMVDFWFNHFNVFVGKGQVRVYLNEYERDAIRPHVLGKFRDLLQATAESPAMLFYLDNWQSAAPEGAHDASNGEHGATGASDPRSRGRSGADAAGTAEPARTLADVRRRAERAARGLNENYARELMELHTLGVDGGYTQKDVQEVARAFTGWTIANPRQGGIFRFEPRMHDDGEKVVLGTRSRPAAARRMATGARPAREASVDGALHRDQARAALRRATSRRRRSSIARRRRFLETDGDIREVVRDDRHVAGVLRAEAYRAKVKTPFEFVVSAVRATGIDVTNAQPLVQAVREPGHAALRLPAADRLRRQGGSVGELRRAAQPHEFRRLVDVGQRRAATRRGRRRSAVRRRRITSDALVASALAGERLRHRRLRRSRRPTTQPQALALVLGSPEFQRK